MDAKKVVKGIEMVEDGLAEIKAGLLAEIGEAEAPEEAPKKKTGKKSAPVEEETPKKKAGKAKTKAAKEEVEDDEDDDEVDYASMKYNDLKKLAVERGMKSPNVSKDEIIAFLKGEPVEDADDEDVEPEDVENETDEEDLTAKVTSMLEDVDTEDIADFLAENGISAKGKRPSLIAKIVTAIEDGDLSLEDLEVEDEDEERELEKEAPKGKKSGDKKPAGGKNRKKVEEPEEDDEEEDEDEEESENPLGYEYDEDEDAYNNDEEESELLATVSSARMDACVAYMEDVEKSIKKKSAKAKLVKELEEFFGDEFDAEEDDIVASAGIKFLLMTDDEGETHDMEDPYEINEIVCCCGRPLTETDDGYVCDVCESEYDDE